MHSIPRRIRNHKDWTKSIHRLTSDISNLNLKLSEFRHLSEEATKQFIANNGHPELQCEIAIRINKKLTEIKTYLLEQLFLDECLQLYETKKISRDQYDMATKLIREKGAIRFAQKMLMSDCTEDIGLSISLHEILPALEKFVEDYSYLFLNQASEAIMKIKHHN
jgi:hypothetical protein